MIHVPSPRSIQRGFTLALAASACLGLGAQGRQEPSRASGNNRVRSIETPPPAPMNAPGATPINNQDRWSNRAAGAGSSAGHGGSSVRPPGVPRPTSSLAYQGQALPRCTIQPVPTFWKTRDLFAELRAMARRGFIQVVPVADETTGIVGSTWFPSGWKAYGFTVPGREQLHVRLHHSNEGWFRLIMTNKWGQTGQGMLQNLIPTGNPEVTFKNLGDTAQNVFVIVDDPGWMSSEANPFTLNIDRSWDPAVKKQPALPMVVGIWASHKNPDTNPEGPKPATAPAPAPAPAPAEAPKG